MTNGFPVRDEKKGAEILKRGLNTLHESLADWILINPGGTLRQMGEFFGYSPAWLCQVINSDMFKAYMATRRSDIVSQIAQGLPQKLESAAHLITEKMIEMIPKMEDKEQVIDAFDKVMHRYGYAPNAKNGAQSGVMIGNQTNVFYLDKDQLQAVRGRLIEAHAPKELPAETGTAKALPELIPAT